MSCLINPLLAIRVPGHELFVLAIVVPMGLAYIVITLQAAQAAKRVAERISNRTR